MSHFQEEEGLDIFKTFVPKLCQRGAENKRCSLFSPETLSDLANDTAGSTAHEDEIQGMQLSKEQV